LLLVPVLAAAHLVADGEAYSDYRMLAPIASAAMASQITQALSRLSGLEVQVQSVAASSSVVEDLLGAEARHSFAFLSGNDYLYAYNNTSGTVEARLVGVINKHPYYMASIYARRDSGIRSIEDLTGKVWIYNDVSSTVGYRAPNAVFQQRGIQVDARVETGSHVNSVKALIIGQGDFCTAYGDFPDPPESYVGPLWEFGDDPECWIWDREKNDLFPKAVRGTLDDVRLAVSLSPGYDLETVQREIGVVANIGPIPNSALVFGPGFPRAVADLIVAAVKSHVSTQDGGALWSSFQAWQDVIEISDDFYDAYRQLLSLPVGVRQPAASFTWQVLSSSGARLLVEPRSGDRIQFDASGSSDPDGRIVSYEWDWESNGSYDTKVTSPTIEHSFSTSGSHRVTLRVTDDQGATGSVTQTVNVGERQAPQALFTFSPTQPSVVDAVQLTDQSSDPDGQVVSWTWEFGDGTTSTDRNPTHTYSRKGTFTVKLTVTDNDGLTGSKSQTLTVVNLPPDASSTFEPQTPVVGQSVRFDGSASSDRDGTISSYAWDFNGDGKTDATGMEATWTFVEAKTYTVTLSVVDSDGATGTAEQDVVVSAAPSGPPRFQQQWGLVIGVGNYQDPAITDLNYTEADAQAFYDFLTGTQGGGFQKDHVRFLLNEQATTASVKAAFRWLISQAGEEDLVVIYFAGHGGTGEDVTVPPDEADGVDEYLITYDAQQADLFSTAVRDDEMADWLASFRCDNVVVILDSCFAAGATRSLEQTGTRAGPGNRVFNDLVGPGRLFLAASKEDEFSYEDAALGHGIFTYYLLRGLGAMEGVTTPEADADQDGRVTVEELRVYLEREVTRAKPQQHPLVTGDLALTRVALDGYGEPLVGEVTAIQGDYVIISLGSRHGVQVGDRFEIVRPYTLPDGSKAEEVRALVQVAAILGPDRSACMLVESHFSVEIGDSVRPAQ